MESNQRINLDGLNANLKNMIHDFVERDGFIISSVNFIEERIKDKQYRISLMIENVDGDVFVEIYEVFGSDREFRIVEVD